MRRNLLSKITNNFPLKIASILIAIVLWYVALYSSDPKDTRSFQVRVEVTNESYIASGKQVYYIDDDYKAVTVYITANSSVIKNINENSISVVADLTEIIDFNRDPVMVPLTVSCPGISRQNISLSRETIPIRIENVASKELPITVSVNDSVPNKDYEIGVLTPNHNSITVNGPESLISKIDSVVAVINVNNMSQNAEKTASLKFISKDQTEISQDIISDDITIEGNGENVIVSVELWKKKSGVHFNVNHSGDPLEGYEVHAISTTPDEITVAGNADALELLAENGNTITIPAERVNVSGLNEDTAIEVGITDLMYNNMKVASSMNDYITVYVKIMPIGSQEFSFDVDDIETLNLDKNQSVSYPQTSLVIKVEGSEGHLLRDLSLENIKASIDLVGLTLGDHTLPVSVILPEGYRLVNNPQINVTLKEKK